MVEVLVVLALTVILMTAIINVFILSLRAQRQAAARQEILLSARSVIEHIAKNIRTSEIDFDAPYDSDGTTGIDGVEEDLYLIDAVGREIIYFNDVGGELKLLVDGQEVSLTNPEKVKVTKFQFSLSDNHPRATMILEFESVGLRPEEIKRVNLQTTVSSRIYK